VILTGLNGESYKINLTKYILKDGDEKKKSKLFQRAINVIRKIYPGDMVCSELYLQGCSSKLYLDIYLPLRRLAIEVDGSQHSTINSHHFKSKLEFYKAQRRDSEKTDFLELNNISLVRLPYGQSESEWRDAILGRFDGPPEDSENE
jgi:hypothetical protein